VSKRTKREWLHTVLEIPLVRLGAIITILLLVGLAIVFLYMLIAILYVLVTLIGNQNVQLLVLTISASGTVASAFVAYRLYRNSVGGAEISIALEDPLETEMKYRIQRTPSQPSAGATQELSEKLHFEFPIVWLNTGPKGGAITNVQLTLVKPISHFPTVLENGEASEDNILVSWTMEIAKPEERVDLNSVRLPTFSGGSQNSMSIGDRESMAVTAKVDLFLMDEKKERRPPKNSWLKIQQLTPHFEFKIQWKTAAKSGLKPNEKSFTIRPKFGEPIQEGPAVTVA